MKIEKNTMTWKDWGWVLGLLFAGLFVLGMFCYDAIINADIVIGDGRTQTLVADDTLKELLK